MGGVTRSCRDLLTACQYRPIDCCLFVVVRIAAVTVFHPVCVSHTASQSALVLLLLR